MKAEVAFPTPAVMGHEISGTVAALGPGVKGPAVGSKVVSAFIMPCGFCTPCGAGRDDLCDNFFAHEPAEGHALRRHDAAAPARRLAARDVLDGRPRRIRGGAGHRRLSARRRPAARRVGGARLRDVHGVWRGSAWRRPAGRRARRGRRRRRRRHQRHPDRPRLRRVADHRGRRARTTSSRQRAVSAPPTSSTRRRPMPRRACAN